MSETDERFCRAIQRMYAAYPGGFHLQVPWGQLFCLISVLHLAMQHPDNPGPASRVCQCFLNRVYASLAEIEPELAELLREGENPAHDVPIGRRRATEPESN